MSVIDDVLKANGQFIQTFTPITAPATRRLAVVACMDYRIPIQDALGLKNGDAYVIRNAGGVITEDVLRSLLIAHHKLGVEEIMIINHTECGMQTFQEEEFRDELEEKTGTAAIAPAQFHTFQNLEKNVRLQILRLRSHPWMPKAIPVWGFIYDVKTGKLIPVPAEGETASGKLPTLTPLDPLPRLGGETPRH